MPAFVASRWDSLSTSQLLRHAQSWLGDGGAVHLNLPDHWENLRDLSRDIRRRTDRTIYLNANHLKGRIEERNERCHGSQAQSLSDGDGSG